MNVYNYQSDGGSDKIMNYINHLPSSEKAAGHDIIRDLENNNVGILDLLNTRHLYKKLYEIKFGDHRLMYVLDGPDDIYLLHACKKQKNKAEKVNLKKAKDRAKELGKVLEKRFV